MSEYTGLLQSFIDNAEETYDTLNRGKFGKVARAITKGQMENLDKITRNQFPLITPESMRADPTGVLQAALDNTPTTNMLGLAIKASHGSPYLFDKFNMSKIGTGEGAQSYGHGLYMAENFNSPVAKQYANAGGYASNSPERVAADLVSQFRGDEQKALGHLQHILPESGQTTFTGASRELIEAAINSIKDKSYRSAESYLYNISLEWPDAAREAVDPMSPHHFLDWDAPFSKQPESVKQLFLNDPELKAHMDKRDTWRKELIANSGNNRNIFSDEFGKLQEQTGEDLLNTIKGSKNVDLFGFPKGYPKTNQNEFASSFLLEHGIPGIRYLDQGSRGAGEGTSNFVVFDDKIPRILERNGEPMLELLRKSLPEMTK